MKCNACNIKEASVLYREIINGKETRYALCPECAAKKEKESALSFSHFSDSLSGGLFESFFAPVSAQIKKREEKRCTLCGSAFRELAKLGKVGCPECYTVFSEELSKTITRLHGNGEHCGKAPAALARELTKDEKIASLEKELREAIEAERYEECAQIRDKIRSIREGE